MGDRLFKENITIHILAILLAIAFWSYVKTTDFTRPESIIFENVPLEIRDIPVGLHLTNELPSVVNVLLRGNASVLEQVLKENLLAYVSLSAAGEGNGQYAVKVIHPQGLSATATPARIEVYLERELTADFAIQIGRPAHDPLLYIDVASTPGFVKVSGLRSQFERVSQARVTVDWPSLEASSLLQLPVKLLDAAGNEVAGLVVEPGVVEVDIVRLLGKEVPVIANLSGQLPEGLDLGLLKIEPENIYIYGATEALAAVEDIFTAAIDLSAISEPTVESIALELPPGITILSEEMVQVTIEVETKE